METNPKDFLICCEPYGTVELGCGYPEPDTYVRENPKIGRNDPCPCGSGRKYKRCCLDKKEEVKDGK